jgi:hypothetical protein
LAFFFHHHGTSPQRIGINLALAFNYRVNRVGGADVIARWQIAFERCRNAQTIEGNNLKESATVLHEFAQHQTGYNLQSTQARIDD